MSSNENPESATSTETTANTETAATPLLDQNVTRRRALQLTGAAIATAAASGTATAATEGEDVDVDFASNYTNVPWIPATFTVEDVLEGHGTLDYVDDNGNKANLGDEGARLARQPDNEDTPHNPVSLQASALHALNDNGNREPHAEYGAFPRGTTYDDDNDTSTDEVDVTALEASHWTLTNATNGSISVSNGANGTLDVSTSAVASGETVTATFDLSTVGSSDATINSGMSRKFLQTVLDIDSLPSGVIVEFALIASDAGEVVATLDPAGDSSTTKVLSSVTGDSQVGEARVGELEDGQAVTLADIQKVEMRVKETDAAFQVHGLNVERESEWAFGTQEYQTTDSDGNTVVETQDVTAPTGTFSILDLETLDSTPFANAAIASVDYDAEMNASELASDSTMARVVDTPDTYDYPKELEVVTTFQGPTAYSLSVTFENMLDEVELPGSRYLGVEVSTASAEFDDWDGVENESWTDRTSNYGSPGSQVELYASVAASDITHARYRVQLTEEEVKDATKSGAVGAVAVSDGGGGGIGNLGLTAILSAFAAGIAWFRKPIMNFLG